MAEIWCVFLIPTNRKGRFAVYFGRNLSGREKIYRHVSLFLGEAGFKFPRWMTWRVGIQVLWVPLCAEPHTWRSESFWLLQGRFAAGAEEGMLTPAVARRNTKYARAKVDGERVVHLPCKWWTRRDRASGPYDGRLAHGRSPNKIVGKYFIF